VALFKEDIEYQIRAGFCRVFLWDDIVKMRPTNLKISPVAVVPQVNRRGRIILDLSFPVYQAIDGVVTIQQKSVNHSMVLKAPSQSVKEIGKVLPWLLQYMHDTPPGLHILFNKLDISDGFWRLTVRLADSYNFAYVLPQPDGKPIQIVVPAALQMGWVESPPLFCTVTESACDLTQHLLTNKVLLPHHELEEQIKIQSVPPRARTSTPSTLLQVYLDDFCHAATESKDGSHIPMVCQASIHGIHSFFPQPIITGHSGGKEPISAKKLLHRDGDFTSSKDMIGFTFDGIKRTVRLPAEKARRYMREIHRVLWRTSVTLKTLQTLVGQLRHPSIILPAARGFFTPINAAMKGNPAVVGLGKGSDVRSALLNLCSLLKILGGRPTHVRELVLTMPRYVGYHNAAAEGAGGVWFSLVHTMSPLFMATTIPGRYCDGCRFTRAPGWKGFQLGLGTGCRGPCYWDPPCKSTVHEVGANWHTLRQHPTVSWIERMASKSLSPMAGRLLRGLAFMLHSYHAGRLTTATVHVPGQDNIMADIASRPSKAHDLFRCNTPTLSDPDFVTAFDRTFPLPLQELWTLAMVPPWLKSNIFETLRGQRLDLRRWMAPSKTVTLTPGPNIATST
jgi:hypothetical protein